MNAKYESPLSPVNSGADSNVTISIATMTRPGPLAFQTHKRQQHCLLFARTGKHDAEDAQETSGEIIRRGEQGQ